METIYIINFVDDITTDNTYVACDWDSRWKDECYDLSEAEVRTIFGIHTIVITAERNNQIFGLFVCSGDVQLLYSQAIILYYFSCFCLFLLHNGSLLCFPAWFFKKLFPKSLTADFYKKFPFENYYIYSIHVQCGNH